MARRPESSDHNCKPEPDKQCQSPQSPIHIQVGSHQKSEKHKKFMFKHELKLDLSA